MGGHQTSKVSSTLSKSGKYSGVILKLMRQNSQLQKRQLCSDPLSVMAALFFSLWHMRSCENETSERDLISHCLEQAKGKRNALHTVVRNLRCVQTESAKHDERHKIIQSQCTDAIRHDVISGEANLAIHILNHLYCPIARSWKYWTFWEIASHRSFWCY